MGRLALVHPRSVRGGFAVPHRRVGAIAGAVAAIIGLLYVGARATPVFAVRAIEISGAPPTVRKAVQRTAAALEGKSLVGLDGAALIRDLEALPSVRSASYDRAFPNTLRIFVRPEPPLAVLQLGRDRWVLSERGRVIARPDESARRLPRFRLAVGAEIQPGSFVADPAARAILGALVALPRRFPARVTAVRLERGALTFVLATRSGMLDLRLGEPADVVAKLAVAGLVLRRIPPAELASADYVDVSIPERVVVGANPQPED